MKALRIGLCLVIAFSVLAHGAVEVWSESLLEMSAAILLVIWSFQIFSEEDRKIHWSALNWPLLGLLGIGLAQLVFHMTAYPFLTRTELLRIAAFFVLFFWRRRHFENGGNWRSWRGFS